MAGIQGTNVPNLINQTVFNALSGNQPASQGAEAVTASAIYNTFFKKVKTKQEFKKKIGKTMKNLNNALSDEEIEDILDSIDDQEQPPFCASYSEEGVSKQLNLEDALTRAEVYDIFLLFYNDLYGEAKKNIRG
jgi:hypothetical protein